MKKVFYTISVLASLTSLLALWFEINIIKSYIPGKELLEIIIYMGLPLFIIVFPFFSLLIGFLKDKKNKLSKNYLVTFIVINIIIALINTFYIFFILNFESI